MTAQCPIPSSWPQVYNRLPSFLTTKELVTELALIIDPALAQALVESYVQMQQRFLACHRKLAELDGGRL
jgi:hypothetical protein